VTSVDPSGTAAYSGIQQGDVIIEVQQTPVSEPDQAMKLLADRASQKERFVAVLVEHEKKTTWMPLAIPK
jgi:S1-C subfamily serine protease